MDIFIFSTADFEKGFFTFFVLKDELLVYHIVIFNCRSSYCRGTGLFWLATKGGGVNKLFLIRSSLPKSGFLIYIHNAKSLRYISTEDGQLETLDPAIRLMGDIIYGISQDSDDNLWVR